jgi:hypothetical protein
VPSVRESDDPDLSDVDDLSALSPYQQTMTLVELVRSEHGPVDMDEMCIAELHSLVWAIGRRRKLASIYQVRSLKRSHQLVTDDQRRSTASLAKRGISDEGSFKAFFAQSGLPVIDL